MSEQCKLLGGPVRPLNCHGCATKECEFKERQLERVMNAGPTNVAVTFVLVACLSFVAIFFVLLQHLVITS